MTRKRKMVPTGPKLFRTSDQLDLLEEWSLEEQLEHDEPSGDDAAPEKGLRRRVLMVKCLGMDFPSDEARRNYFLEKLRERLKDPEFRRIEGFPIGDDEDILRLSDPPYHTACPNPFIRDFLQHHGKPYDPVRDDYKREPFASDVSEGKTDPIYTAHPYHTKVPPKAVMRYISHFTGPGDIVLDGFCGTGMVGVASHGLARASVNSGKRLAILCDLSPAATFIAHNYVHPASPGLLKATMNEIISAVDQRLGWMYETIHPDTKEKGRIEFTVWSDVFSCPECGGEINYYSARRSNVESEDAGAALACPSCGADLGRRELERLYSSEHDSLTGQIVRRIRRVPVLIQYTFRGARHTKQPDEADIDLLRRIEAVPVLSSIPHDVMMFRNGKWGDEWRRGRHEHISHAHHFYKARPLHLLSALWGDAMMISDKRLQHAVMFEILSLLLSFTDMNRYRPSAYSQVNQYMSGVLYIGALQAEPSLRYCFDGKTERLTRALGACVGGQSIISTCSSTGLDLPHNSIDYVFVDPPFGDNLHYSELNFLWESWHRVFTNSEDDAIVSEVLNRDIAGYGLMMQTAFQRFHNALKPGRWMTVEFHNSKNSVWSAIQEALQRAGFVIADVRTLDKQQGTFKQVNAAGAVKQDLIISAYKPGKRLAERFKLHAGSEEYVWEFVRNHLSQLPVFIDIGDRQAEPVTERMSYLLFDRMVAFHVERGVTVPLSAAEFYAGLKQRFPERESMYFLPDQVSEYDRKRLTVKEILQLELAPSDESTAIVWIRQRLERKPLTFKELTPEFMIATAGWERHERPLELRDLLAENFLLYEGVGPIPEQIWVWMQKSASLRELMKGQDREHPTAQLRGQAKDRWYMPDPNKAQDLERLRERALLKEFDDYGAFKGKTMKVFRLEAVRAGFKKAWQERDYATIIEVARKIPEAVLQEDAKLLMWYDQALTRSGEGG
jgi:DNA modification methylase/predicted RNA-binding Zn-ribbon protein involved in translation (DUF1610 family)